MKLIEIEWLDSKGVTPRWDFIDELSSLKPSKCKSVGYVVENKKKYITIAQTTSKEQLLGRLTIPKCSIIKKRKI